MLRSLRDRITFAYMAFVVILFVVVAGVLANEAIQLYVRNVNDAVATASTQIREIAANNPNADFQTLATMVHNTVLKPGLRIGVFQHPHIMRGGPMAPMQPGPGGPPGSGPGPNPPPDFNRDSGYRIVFSIGNLAGLHPARIDTPNGSFFVSMDPNRLRSILESYSILFIAGLIAFGALGWLIGGYLARHALAPMAEVTEALRRFAGGDFTPQRIATRERSEVGDLADAFNGAAAQVAAAFDERRRVEEYIRQFVADASHELRTPLTVIRGYLDVLQRGALNDPAKRERAFRTLDAESSRMRALIDKLVILARLERPEPSQVSQIDIASVARNIAEATRNVPGHPPVSLDLDDGAHVLAEEAEIHEAIANLVDNARKYGEGAPIEVKVRREDLFVTARVIDAGPGIPPEEQEHIFDRFYRGASRGEIEGSGLGLSIAVQAINRAHGTLRLVQSRPGQTIFEIKLPTAGFNRRQLEAEPARR